MLDIPVHGVSRVVLGTIPVTVPNPGMIGLNARVRGNGELVDGVILVRVGMQIVKIPLMITVLVEDTRSHSTWKPILPPIPDPAGMNTNCSTAEEVYPLLFGSASEPYKFNAHAVIQDGISGDTKNNGYSRRYGCKRIS